MLTKRLKIVWPCPHGIHGGMYCRDCESIIDLLEMFIDWAVNAIIPERWMLLLDGRDYIRDDGTEVSFLNIVNDGDVGEIGAAIELVTNGDVKGKE